ncbi:NADP-dependent oxidoreductase [Actibacterium sp. 188UL27-1]|uniref:NADP-dependent oxidoreductase n=1 Tax=Actibacterium sp. 188UL27-1 TaxID=2786961 RepID=UPI00195641B5|nr:NADP-dependent oxidoreductase [Actibacterium sp. 188UL27-1]MBM7069543.1 NADP-dependent oxidoreductase [Actibacterium sp. 188UL27-1]
MADFSKIVLAGRPQGAPTPEHFRLEHGALPQAGEGEVLVRTIWMSLDPYMRGRMDDAKSYADPVPLGGTMEGGGVGEVIASHAPGFAPGDIVVGRTGWASHAALPADEIRKVDPSVAPISTALGVLGMPGHTAWVGLNDIAQAKSGETIVVSAATGAVGSLVGQLAKTKGMRVIGVAGGPDKCAFATDELGFDACLDHRAAPDWKTLSAQIKEAAPKGVDVYFENVGGKTLDAVLPRMNTWGRIAICGMIAWYSGQGVAEAAPLPVAWRTILTRRLRVQGYIIFDHNDRYAPFAQEVAPMVADGRIRYRETVAEGLENAPQAFLDLLKGGNFGKQLVRVGEDPGA